MGVLPHYAAGIWAGILYLWRERGVRRVGSRVVVLIVCLLGAGCASGPQVATPNPFFVPSGSYEGVWERSVDVLHDYQFEIAREDELEGMIETQPKVGSGLIELWQQDSVGFEERLESSMQTIRRRAFLSITPTEGGHLVGVQVYKELEDGQSKSAESMSFRDYSPLQRDLDLEVGRDVETGWLGRGRDPRLEQALLNRLQRNFSQ